MYSKKVLPGEVRDDEGRRRFHGAFTGGFSAGYYNSVGSSEGWTPSTFVSSRDKRANAPQQRAEDFMDEEDGLLGKEVLANADYDTLGVSSSAAAKTAALNEAQSSRSLIPGAAPMELMVVSGQPIGKRLLQTMGWREGTGVGARVKRRNKTGIDEAEDIVGTSMNTSGGIKGLSMDSGGGSIAELLGSSFNNTNKHALDAVTDDGDITFAPDDKEARIKIPKPKNDTYGCGYDPFKENPEFEHARRGDMGNSQGVYRMGMGIATGSHVSQRNATGFAVDDGEDDVYDSGLGVSGGFREVEMGDEDVWMGGVQHAKDIKLPQVFQEADDLSSLPGFICPKITNADIPLYWQPPAIPRSWRPLHHFTEPGPAIIETRKNRPSVAARQEMLGDKPAYRPSLPERPSSVKDEPVKSNQGGDTRQPLLVASSKCGDKAVPFALNPALAAAMKSRFAPSVEVLKPDTTEGAGGLKVLNVKAEPSEQDIKSTVALPPPLIQLTSSRDIGEWIPDSLLCKRFNVPPPSKSKQGIPQQKTLTSSDAGGQIVQDRYKTHVAPFIQANQVEDQVNVSELKEVTSTKEDHMPKLDSSQLLANIEQVHSTSSVITHNTMVESQEEEPPKPAVDFFKAIFEPSDESSSDDEESDEEDNSDVTESKSAVKTDDRINNEGYVSNIRSTQPARPIQPMRPSVQPSRPIAQSSIQPSLHTKRERFEPAKPLPKEVAPDALYAMLQGSSSEDDSDSDNEKKDKKHKKKKHKSDKKKKRKKEKQRRKQSD